MKILNGATCRNLQRNEGVAWAQLLGPIMVAVQQYVGWQRMCSMRGHKQNKLVAVGATVTARTATHWHWRDICRNRWAISGHSLTDVKRSTAQGSARSLALCAHLAIAATATCFSWHLLCNTDAHSRSALHRAACHVTSLPLHCLTLACRRAIPQRHRWPLASHLPRVQHSEKPSSTFHC